LLEGGAVAGEGIVIASFLLYRSSSSYVSDDELLLDYIFTLSIFIMRRVENIMGDAIF
jgi:hypothetical protein